MNQTMAAEEMSALFANNLYERKEQTYHYGIVECAVPNYNYCRKDAPIYEWHVTQWVRVSGNLAWVVRNGQS